ncbi:Uncharacterised protein [Escherichia coli]|nr:Uncharacterised protein [Escherichia coli]
MNITTVHRRRFRRARRLPGCRGHRIPPLNLHRTGRIRGNRRRHRRKRWHKRKPGCNSRFIPLPANSQRTGEIFKHDIARTDTLAGFLKHTRRITLDTFEPAKNATGAVVYDRRLATIITFIIAINWLSGRDNGINIPLKQGELALKKRSPLCISSFRRALSASSGSTPSFSSTQASPSISAFSGVSASDIAPAKYTTEAFSRRRTPFKRFVAGLNRRE